MPKWRKWKNWIRKEKKERKKEKRYFVFWNRTTSTDSIDLLCWNEYRVTLLSSPRWLNSVTGDETGLTSQLISTPSLSKQPMKGCSTTPESTPPTLYDQQCGFFYVLQESEQWKSCETEPTVFLPYPRRLELYMSQRRQHILLSFFKTLSVGPAGVWTHDLPLGRPALIQLS